MTKKILFSGIKPTGDLHIGNYIGALQNWVILQNTFTAFYAIVDYHALTQDIAPNELQDNTHKLAVDLLSLGINPKKSTLFVQSDVPEHTELTWIFNCLTPVSELERMTQYKDFVGRKTISANMGLLDYPILQTADILIYKAMYVPVGEDQLQHLELARIIARKFNQRYKKYFPEIQPILSEQIRVMSLNQPTKKMSKSLGPKSYIALRDKPDTIRQKIAKAVTDTGEANTTLSGAHNLLMLFKHFAPPAEYTSLAREYKLDTLSYKTLKDSLSQHIIDFLKPVQDKQAYYEKHPVEVDKILKQGAAKARKIAQENMAEIRRITGLRISN